MAAHSLRRGTLEVSLTDDVYETTEAVFTLEVTRMEGDEGIENDAATSGVKVSAGAQQIKTYLEAALECATVRARGEMSVRNVAVHADMAGVEAVKRGAGGECKSALWEDEDSSGETMSHNNVVENIAEVLRAADGKSVEMIYNQVCCDQVKYEGDSLYRRVPSPGGTSAGVDGGK